MISNPVIFYTAAVIIILFTLLTLFCRNIIRALLCSIIVFFGGAILFYILGSEYNSIIQAAIYGLAVPIIIGLSIMFTSQRKSEVKLNKTGFITLICIFIFVFLLCDIIALELMKNTNLFVNNAVEQLNFYDTFSSFAKNIFINYVWAFELLSVLLTIVIAGLTLFKRKGV